MLIRPGRGEEQARLREIAVSAKAHWPYDADFLARFADLVLTAPDYFDAHQVWVAEEDTGDLVAFYSLVPDGEVCVLDDLWVLPARIGTGLGRRLFEHALARAAEAGCARMEWEADPHAAGFYRRMGGVVVHTVTSELGRTLDVMSVDTAVTPHGPR